MLQEPDRCAQFQHRSIEALGAMKGVDRPADRGQVILVDEGRLNAPGRQGHDPALVAHPPDGVTLDRIAEDAQAHRAP